LTRAELVRAGLALAAPLVLSGPTAGDIGGCGQEPDLLDDAKFFEQKARLDCSKCESCGLASERCEVACEGGDPRERFPTGCAPLVHDGEVCLRALGDASCDEYAGFMADRGATISTECAFCPEEAR
jgi:hypothetical protein